MSITIPTVKINSSDCVQNNKQTYYGLQNSGTPSFGFKSIEVPDKGKTARFLNFLDDNFDSAWQRLIAGVTAIFTQPFFDLHNKDADEETRITSCARTISKIVVGTVVGVAIRAACINLIGNFTRNEATEKHLKESNKKFKTLTELEKSPITHCLLDKNAFKKATYREIKKYRGALGTFAALGVMIFSNFLIDAPWTMKMTNFLAPKMLEKYGDKKTNSSEGGNK